MRCTWPDTLGEEPECSGEAVWVFLPVGRAGKGAPLPRCPEHCGRFLRALAQPRRPGEGRWLYFTPDVWEAWQGGRRVHRQLTQPSRLQRPVLWPGYVGSFTRSDDGSAYAVALPRRRFEF